MKDLLIFDMDGVLTEVSESYRESIVQTVLHFTGRAITREKIQEYKNQGGWNNDWALSRKIASDLGVEVAYEDVVTRFNEIFLGSNGDGLITRERWFPSDGLLERLSERFQMGIFTGRLRMEADITLRRFAPSFPFDPIVCADDVLKGKPDPEGLHRIQASLPERRLFYVGDTIDDARSASAAGVPFIGIAARGHSRYDELVRLFSSENAIAILDDINQLENAI
ncbi:MAG: HAD-IA family hydrolase [Bryobacteraceae bacterium]|nr:HAD-IA family hydrolase [Bryobacteraceae bacterium]